MGEIPVLEEDGVRLTQTAPILLRLSEQYGRFGGRSEAERFEVLRWLFWDNHKLTGYLATYRFRRSFTQDADPAVQAFLRARLDDFLGVLDRHVAAQGFVAGDVPTVADLSLTGYLVFPAEETGYDLARQFPRIQGWLDRVAALPGWMGPYDLLPGKRLVRYV
jgi:glutathione S-transferase